MGAVVPVHWLWLCVALVCPKDKEWSRCPRAGAQHRSLPLPGCSHCPPPPDLHPFVHSARPQACGPATATGTSVGYEGDEATCGTKGPRRPRLLS